MPSHCCLVPRSSFTQCSYVTLSVKFNSKVILTLIIVKVLLDIENGETNIVYMPLGLLWGGMPHSWGFVQQRMTTGIFLLMVLRAACTHTPLLSLLYPVLRINWMAVITPSIKTNNKSPTYLSPLCGYAFCWLPNCKHYTIYISLFARLCCSLFVFLLQPQSSYSALSLCCYASLYCTESSV